MNPLAKLIAVVGFIYLLGTLPLAVFQSSKAESPQNNSVVTNSNESQKSSIPATSYIDDYRNVKEGSLAIRRGEEPGFDLSPAIDTSVDISVTGLVARAKVTQTFINPSNEWINAIYVFPLPENAAVDHMQMTVGEKVIQGEIQPKAKAKAIYQKAKREGKKASLLSQSRANLFTNSIANVAPGESIKVTIEYQHKVEYKNERFQLRYPMTMTPRYIPGKPIETEISSTGWGRNTSEVPDAANITPPTKTAHSRQNNVSISVALSPGMKLHNIDSEFHPVTINKEDAPTYQVELSNSVVANQDFVLNWQPAKGEAPSAALFSQQKGDHEYGLMLLMPPQVEQEQMFSIAREVVYVIDTSGSMSGESMHQAKMALDMAVTQLTQRDSFNIIEFNSYARALWSFAREANQTNKNQARNFVQGLTADGGTEILPALQLALENQAAQSNEHKVRQVVFLTDGSVGNEEALMKYINDNLRRSRLFTIGIGSAPNSYFMSEAAKVGKGTYTYIGSVDHVKDKMSQLFKKLKYPALTDLTIDLPEDVEFYPAVLPDLYFGEPVVISYKTSRSLKHLTLSGRLNQQPWQSSVFASNKGTQSGLNVNWAREKIAQLTHQRRRSLDPEEQNKQILETAMNHHLVSEFTSLVAVDITPSNPGIDSKDKAVKNHLPKGSNSQNRFAQLPQTATSAQLNMLVGAIFLGMGLCILILKRSKKRHFSMC